MPPPDDRLSAYRSKRSGDRTPEPFATASGDAGGIFVVQKHAATRLHYDLRLEHDGVLMSWAIPAGPSLDPQDKRFAVQTEDHPLEYADFEGTIPKGEYGGGEMIVWDRGALRWAEEPGPGLASGKLLFDLTGYKLNGRWTLVRMKKDNEWLLIKKPDGWDRTDHGFDETSILTGRTVDEVALEPAHSEAILATVADAPAGSPDPPSEGPMLAETSDTAFSDPEWLFEIKYDGYRLLAHKDSRQVTLRYRSGKDATDLYPEIASAIAHLPFESIVLDGELVVAGEGGLPDFHALQRRASLSSPAQIQAASVASPTTLFTFDLLSLDGRDLRSLPLERRKQVLAAVVPTTGPVRYVDHIVGRGEAMYDQVQRMGLEGVVAKRSDSPYLSARSDTWRKIRVEHEDVFAIVGYTSPQGGRSGLGALHIAYVSAGILTYAGRVGTGFSDRELTRLRSMLDESITPGPRCAGETPSGADNVWVEPALACHVRYKEVTRDGALRHPVYLGLLDLRMDDVLELSTSQTPPDPVVIDERDFAPSNPDKVFWPNEGYTKSDLIEYYEAVAGHLLPYLSERPIVLDRYPDGISGGSFFQKNAPPSTPRWVRVERIETKEDRGNDYFIVEDVAGLRYLANLASIPLHVWASRITTIDSPDWCILDLDPKEAPFASVVRVANVIRELCDDIGLPTRVKTSGQSGLHILIPMGRGFTYDQQKLIGELIARVVEATVPGVATTVRNPASRGGKVYIDYLQNGKGKLLVAPYSARPVPGATVSTPLEWVEVDGDLDVSRFTIATMSERLSALDADPLDGLLTETPNIRSSLERLAGHLPQ